MVTQINADALLLSGDQYTRIKSFGGPDAATRARACAALVPGAEVIVGLRQATLRTGATVIVYDTAAYYTHTVIVRRGARNTRDWLKEYQCEP